MRAFAIICFFFISFESSSQNEFWGQLAIKFDLAKKLDASVAVAPRKVFNTPYVKSVNTSLAIDYKLTKQWKVGLGYRYTYKFTTYSNRFFIEAKWQDRLVKRTQISWRPRLQLDADLNQKNVAYTFRNKLSIDHKLKSTKLYPFVYTELFTGLKSPVAGLSRLRYGFGLKYKGLKKQDIQVGWFANQTVEDYRFVKKRNIFTLDYIIQL
jgi:hypothetical protein